LRPAYYGRYVDDMLLVVSGYKYQSGRDVINDLLVSNGILSAEEERFSLRSNPELKIQNNKILIEYFDYRESRAALNTFKKNIDKNRSEFRLLPFDNDIDVEFEDEVFSLEYCNHENERRSSKEISINKYGASKYLAHKLFLSTTGRDQTKRTEKNYRKSVNLILSYFKHKNALAMSSLWEKVASFFVVNNDTSNLGKFYKLVDNAIEGIDSIADTDNHKEVERLQRDLKKYLNIAVAMPLAMNPDMDIKVKDKDSIASYATSEIHICSDTI
jgi:hypothetical protein